ncbi:modulator of smoothened protein [Rana temporaria]|nr:modulator of smoothened protein [Rana temporaria]
MSHVYFRGSLLRRGIEFRGSVRPGPQRWVVCLVCGGISPLRVRGERTAAGGGKDMDKLTIISGCLFLAADIFAIASIANPDWINTGESAGALTVGLVRQCQTIHGRDRICIPPRLPPEWVTTLFFIIMGIISLTVTCGLLVASHWRREATKYARWIAFTGMILFCMAALIFPIGFYINEVGGQPYKLPNNTVVGSSYVLFVLSIFFTIVGLLFAGKVCLPG